MLRPATDAVERADGRSAVACHPDGPPRRRHERRPIRKWDLGCEPTAVDVDGADRVRADRLQSLDLAVVSGKGEDGDRDRRGDDTGQHRHEESTPPEDRASADRLTGRVLQLRASPGEELTHLGGSVGRQRREVRRQPRSNELKDALRVFDVLQLVRAEVDELDVGQLLVLDDRRGRLREENLPAVPGGHDSRGAVHPEADVVVVRDRRLTGVHAHPDPEPRVGGPGVSLEGLLGCHRSRNGILGARKGVEERVSLRVDLVAVVGRERLTDQAAVLRQERPRTARAVAGAERVDPSTSVKTKVTVPVGSSVTEIERCALPRACQAPRVAPLKERSGSRSAGDQEDAASRALSAAPCSP